MKILMFGDELVMGGCQINAIELGAALRDQLGFEVVYFATPGPLLPLVKQKSLKFVPAPLARMHPSVSRCRALVQVIRSEKPDVVHAWEWGQCIDAFYGAALTLGVPVILTHMSMDPIRVLPKSPITTFGTPELKDGAVPVGWKAAEVLVPPVDTVLNAPEAVDGEALRKLHGIATGELLLVTVSRLHRLLKSESLLASIEAVRTIGRALPIRLLIVGDGELRPKLEQAAADANAEVGRHAVTLTGEMLDPRTAYAAADIVVGMGGSALRGMAFAKPTIIVGEDGFAKPFSPETARWFWQHGIYGRGRTPGSGLAETIDMLARDRSGLAELGAFSREFVVQNYSLQSVAAQLAEICHAAVLQRPSLSSRARDAARTGILLVVEGKLVPYWSLRRAYHDFGGPPLLPWMRAMRQRLSKAAARLSGASS